MASLPAYISALKVFTKSHSVDSGPLAELVWPS